MPARFAATSRNPRHRPRRLNGYMFRSTGVAGRGGNHGLSCVLGVSVERGEARDTLLVPTRRPGRQRDPTQHRRRPCRDHHRDPQPTRAHVRREHRPDRPIRAAERLLQPSNGWATSACATTTATASDCRPFKPLPPHTAPSWARGHEPRTGSPSRSHSRGQLGLIGIVTDTSRPPPDRGLAVIVAS
jgi:hypothetical protein